MRQRSYLVHKVHSKQSHKAVSKSETIKKETVTFMKYVDFECVRKVIKV